MIVTFEKMTDADFNNYLSFAVDDYAKEKVTAGTWAVEDAVKLAQASFTRLLPNGKETEGEFLFTIIDASLGKQVGYLWFQLNSAGKEPKLFIYDFIIYDAYQNQGYGTAALECLDQLAREMNVYEVGLHVFAHNKGAVHLYEKLGYTVTDLTMVKTLT
ncbi:Acetyltransferase (GNAT) family protein [Amphibacillus marinus]|uniref:Acetyltransferase (GNAT) family protein n=1 Tax=Amphibacillus marinus TaxID=872970 RepID=A0A1H8S7Q9_9BACI|nr:GNAT family N-acetyltransferase [Amphibacillus marinus]SEO75079.1 Acetyltransferase (GNAT) family protein [Amphibacillus marinus]